MMGTLANSEDTDEMLHNATFHQDLHCLKTQKRSAEKEVGIFWAILGRGPRGFQIGKISMVNPWIGKLVIVHNYSIFGQLKKNSFYTYYIAI